MFWNKGKVLGDVNPKNRKTELDKFKEKVRAEHEDAMFVVEPRIVNLAERPSRVRESMGLSDDYHVFFNYSLNTFVGGYGYVAVYNDNNLRVHSMDNETVGGWNVITIHNSAKYPLASLENRLSEYRNSPNVYQKDFYYWYKGKDTKDLIGMFMVSAHDVINKLKLASVTDVIYKLKNDFMDSQEEVIRSGAHYTINLADGSSRTHYTKGELRDGAFVIEGDVYNWGNVISVDDDSSVEEEVKSMKEAIGDIE